MDADINEYVEMLNSSIRTKNIVVDSGGFEKWVLDRYKAYIRGNEKGLMLMKEMLVLREKVRSFKKVSDN